MKKSVFFLLLLGGLASQLFSQVTVNPQLGMNITSLDYKVVDGSGFVAEANVGYQLGFVLRTGGTFYLEPGLFLMGTNQKYVVTDDSNINVTGQTGSHSMQLPVRVGITTGRGEGVFNLRLAAGPVLGYTIGAKDNPFNITEADFNDLQYAGKVGLGFDIFIATIDFDYQVGLNDVFKDGSTFRLGTLAEGGRNNALMITAGIKF
ncbi:MAG: hypothetical protein R3B47_13595 [Bacteroidia bacterium]